MDYPSNHFHIQVEEARDYDGENIEEAYADKRGSGEVAIASEWDIKEEFDKSTFCLVLENTQLIYISNLKILPIYISKTNFENTNPLAK